MAQPTITISAPNGSTAIPRTATGTAMPMGAGATLMGMAYKINNGSLNPISTFMAAGGDWSFQLTQSDCPVIGATYLLSVFVGQSTGEFNSTAVSIVRTGP